MKIDEEEMLMVFFILFIELIYVDDHAYWLKEFSTCLEDFFAIIPLNFGWCYIIHTHYIRDREVWNKLL